MRTNTQKKGLLPIMTVALILMASCQEDFFEGRGSLGIGKNDHIVFTVGEAKTSVLTVKSERTDHDENLENSSLASSVVLSSEDGDSLILRISEREQTSGFIPVLPLDTKSEKTDSKNIVKQAVKMMAVSTVDNGVLIPEVDLQFSGNWKDKNKISIWDPFRDGKKIELRWPSYEVNFFAWAMGNLTQMQLLENPKFDGLKGIMSFDYNMPESDEKDDAKNQPDLLFANTRSSIKEGDEVRLSFDHMLSAVRFEVGKTNDIVVKSITLDNILSHGTCTYDPKDPVKPVEWTNLDSPKSYTQTFTSDDGTIHENQSYEPGTKEPQKIGDESEIFMLIPQASGVSADSRIHMTFVFEKDGEEKKLETDLTVEQANWLPGKEYKYTINVGKSRLIYHWNDNGIITHSKAHIGDEEVFESIDFNESGTYEITLHEPLWIPESKDDYYSFLGWSKSKDATAAEYVQKGRSETEGLPYQIDLHSETVDLYAVWKKVDFEGAWIDYQAYTMNAFDGFRFDHIDSWEFNKSFAFTSSVSKGFEKIGFPIHNLEVGRWYTITFSEDVLPHEKAYNVQSGVYGNTVHESEQDIKRYNKGSMISYTTDYNKNMPVIHVWTHTLSDNIWGENAVHNPMSNQQTTFYASAETMWWIWDLSKICDNETKQYHFSHSKIEMMDDPTGPAIDFRNASFHGFKFKADDGSSEDGRSDESADNKGRSTYKVKSDFTSSEMKMWGTGNYEKINIPLINLEPGATYKLSFNYTLEALYCTDTPVNWPNNDFCFGVRPEKNTKTDKGNFKDTEGYSSFITTNIADCQNKYMEMTFTVPADKNTMYFIWSLSGLSDHTFFHQLITNAKLEKQ